MIECLCEKQGRFPLVSHDLITSLTSAEFSQVYVGKVFHDLAHCFALSISSGRGFSIIGAVKILALFCSIFDDC